jgi:membrane fusion protein, multidrug efflux system
MRGALSGAAMGDRTMTRRARWWLAIVGLIAVVTIGGAAALTITKRSAQAEAAKKREQPTLEFAASDVVKLQPRRLAVELALPGSVQAISQATVRAKLSAEVKRVLVREGDRVTAGQTVAEFDTAQLRAQLAERSASYESAKAQLATNERTRQANAQLVKQNFISQNAFDTADSAYQAQLAAVAAARAQLEQTQLLLADAVVRAPIAGTVAKRNVQSGEKVAFDAPLLSIVDLSQLEVQAQVPVSDVARVRGGMPAEVEIEGLAGRKFAGRVERINPSTEPGTRTINIYVSLPNEDALLRAGMFARVALVTSADAEVPSLPISALRTDNGTTFVWVINDGRLARRIVETGRRDERVQLVEILGGVGPGETVLATKFDNLKDGLSAKVMTGLGEARVADKDAPRGDVRTN